MKKIVRAINNEQIESRRNEIIQSCYKTYLEKGFKKTSIKDISDNITFARSSIYNYYQTKEEIFLDMLRQEYDYLVLDLRKILHESVIDKQVLSKKISSCFSSRLVLLQIISSSLNEIEEYSRIENLIEFKKSFASCLNVTRDILNKFTDLSEKRIELFIELFFPFLFGLCAYTNISKRQREAMLKASVNWHKELSTEELCYDFILEFLEK